MDDKKRRVENELFGNVENLIAETGPENIEVADEYLTFGGIQLDKANRSGHGRPFRLELITDEGLPLDRGTVLDWYMFSGSMQTHRRIKQIRAAFAHAMPTWSAIDPAAAESAIQILRDIAHFYHVTGNFHKWEKVSKEMVNLCRTYLGHNRGLLLIVLADTAFDYLKYGQRDEADAYGKEALTYADLLQA